MTVQVRLASEQDLPAVFALRHLVFVVGQDVPQELERDGLDAVSDHAVALAAEPEVGTGSSPTAAVVGTGRLAPDGTIGRLAVAAPARGRGTGAAVLALLEERARQRGIQAVGLHAQLHARPFYERRGYLAFGEVYLEAGIEHISMRKSLC